MSSTIINRTQNGQVFRCSKCKAIHIEYKNLRFNFSVQQFDNFADYLSKFDDKKWDSRKLSYVQKKIIPTV